MAIAAQEQKRMELLAPAGDMAALRAAVCTGADAVYLGYSAFSARASAVNFDAEALARAVEYAHLYHRRIYVTVNTLVKERELEAVYNTLEAIALAGTDAVIVQDLGVAALVRHCFPTLGLHASTQMALHNTTGVRWAGEQGFGRVVLARECSLAEIAGAAHTGVEVEVFVHGALCAGVSGQCLMSSMAGGRSGNRGRCAQPCRQQFALAGKSGALLSTRDLCLRDHLPELWQAGVHSLKIEGRLKRPEYVAVVVDSYRRALDELAAGTFVPGNIQEKEKLMQVFHRGGFSIGHAMGAEDADVCGASRVGHQGLSMGQVVHVKNNLATLRLARDLHDGDGLQVQSRQGDVDVRYSGKDACAGGEAVLRLRPGDVAQAGDAVRRLTDVRQMAWAQAALQEKPIAITMEAVLAEGEPMGLTISDGTEKVTVFGETPQPAKTKAITAQEVCKQLTKLGETPFALNNEDDSTAKVADGLFMPVSALNALRRKAVEGLAEARIKAFLGAERAGWLEAYSAHREDKRAEALSWLQGRGNAGSESDMAGAKGTGGIPMQASGVIAEASGPPQEKRQKPLLLEKEPWKQGPVVRFQDAEMARPLQEAGAAMLIFAPGDLRPEPLKAALALLPANTWVELPPQMGEEDLHAVQEQTEGGKSTLGGVVLGSVGQLGAAFSMPIALGSGVPVPNHPAMQALGKHNPAFFVLWPEWSYADLRSMLPFAIPPLMTVYGRERLMLLNHCPARVAQGLRAGRKSCALCQENHRACGEENPLITDRKGYRFPLTKTRMQSGCVVNVLGSLPTDLHKHEDKRKALGAGMLLSFTVEAPERQLELVREYAAAFKGEACMNKALNPSGEQTTAGHLLRGVE